MQETKKENFDLGFIKKICPPSFDSFEFLPSIGASGGCITIWQSNKLNGAPAFMNEYSLAVEFISLQSGQKWILSNIYAPCEPVDTKI